MAGTPLVLGCWYSPLIGIFPHEGWSSFPIWSYVMERLPQYPLIQQLHSSRTPRPKASPRPQLHPKNALVLGYRGCTSEQGTPTQMRVKPHTQLRDSKYLELKEPSNELIYYYFLRFYLLI